MKCDTRTLAAWHRAVRHLFVGETRRERRVRMRREIEVIRRAIFGPRESREVKRHRAEMLRQVNDTPGAVWTEGMEAPVCPA